MSSSYIVWEIVRGVIFATWSTSSECMLRLQIDKYFHWPAIFEIQDGRQFFNFLLIPSFLVFLLFVYRIFAQKRSQLSMDFSEIWQRIKHQTYFHVFFQFYFLYFCFIIHFTFFICLKWQINSWKSSSKWLATIPLQF